jgi:integrase/recombinase XerC
MRSHIPAFIHHLSGRRAARTVLSYAATASAFADFLNAQKPVDVPMPADVETFLARPTRSGVRRAPATRNQELAALRAFTKFVAPSLGWSVDPTEGIPFVREPAHDPAVLTAFELRRLFLAAAGIEDPLRRSLSLALLAVLSQVGLRVHEAVALELHQVDLVTGTLVAVRGKGGTICDLPLNAPSLALLTAWIADRQHLASADEPALFVSSHGTRLSVRSVQRLMAALRKATGTPKHVTPHTLRHTAATLALTMGADLSTVADLLRHSDLNTTRRYLHLVDERRREAVRRLGCCVPKEILPDEEKPAAHLEGPAPGAGGVESTARTLQPSVNPDQDSLNTEPEESANGLDVQHRFGANRRAA